MRHYVPNPPRGLRRLLSEFSFGIRLLVAPRRRVDAVVALHPALFSTWIWSWRQRKTPRVHWVQDIYVQGLSEIGEGGGLAVKVTRWIESRVLRSAARVVVIHERFRDRIVGLYGLDPARIVVMRNWTYIEASGPIDRMAARRARGWGDEIVVLYTGNFGAKQGLEFTVEAARIADARNSPIRFVLMGGGGEEGNLKALAGADGPGAEPISRVEFLGPQRPDDFRAALAAADILLVSEKPGVAESSVPSKMATYFGSGHPVLAVGTPDGITAGEVALAGAGVSIAGGDPQAILDAALQLGADRARADSYGASGRRYRETVLDQEVALDRWASILSEVIEEHRRP